MVRSNKKREKHPTPGAGYKHKYATSCKKRQCPSCKRSFNPMTDVVWKNVERTHKRSIGHKKRIKRKSR